MLEEIFRYARLEEALPVNPKKARGSMKVRKGTGERIQLELAREEPHVLIQLQTKTKAG